MQYVENLLVGRTELDKISTLLCTEPQNESEVFGEDRKIIHSVTFENGIEMSIELCGVKYEEGESNLPYTQAVLYKGAIELTFTEPQDEYIGGWICCYDGDDYIVNVSAKQVNLNKDAFLNYIKSSYTINVVKLMSNTLDYIEGQDMTRRERKEALMVLFNGIGIDQNAFNILFAPLRVTVINADGDYETYKWKDQKAFLAEEHIADKFPKMNDIVFEVYPEQEGFDTNETHTIEDLMNYYKRTL